MPNLNSELTMCVDENLPPVGIDISKSFFDACILGNDGTRRKKRFDQSEAGFSSFAQWIAEHAGERVAAGVEATGPWGINLMMYLFVRGHQIALLNPRRVRNFARSQGRRVKTDDLDAEVIAEYVRALKPRLWTPASPAILELQSLIRRREQLCVSKTAATNRLSTLRATQNDQSPCIQSLQRELDFVKAEIKRIDKCLVQLCRNQPELRKAVELLRSIPGIGRIVALTILAEIPLITAFSRARDVAAFVGVTPSLERSGTSVWRRGSITREGSALLRKKLYMAAMNVVRRDNPLRPCYQRLLERGKAKKAAMVAIMHKLIRIAFGVLKHETPFVEKLARAS